MTDFSIDQIRPHLNRWSNLKDLPPQEQKRAVGQLAHRNLVGENEIEMEILTGAPPGPSRLGMCKGMNRHKQGINKA